LILFRQGEEVHADARRQKSLQCPLAEMLYNDEIPSPLYNGMMMQQGNTDVSKLDDVFLAHNVHEALSSDSVLAG
jgi:hypothetical protein